MPFLIFLIINISLLLHPTLLGLRTGSIMFAVIANSFTKAIAEAQYGLAGIQFIGPVGIGQVEVIDNTVIGIGIEDIIHA
ncbi:hypothetical protein D3C87_1896280 [compost metagenome]